MSSLQIALGGENLFPKFPCVQNIHALVDEAYRLSVENGRERLFAQEPFPVWIAEGVRRVIIEGSKHMGDEFGPVVAEAARRGYWLQGPWRRRGPSRNGAFWFAIWYIDSSLELCGCKPAALTRTFRDATAWILAAPMHEFEGELESAHERLLYMSERQRCLKDGSVWSWPASH